MATSSPLKIGLVLDDSLDKPDGVQQYVLTLGAWLTRQGHEVRYLVGETKRQDLSGVFSLSRNIHVKFNHNYMSTPLPASEQKLQQLLARERFDVLHVQLPYSPWLAHKLIRLAHPSTVVFGTFHVVAHSRLVKVATHGLSLWTRSSLNRFDEIVSVSSAAAQYAAQTYHIHTDVAPNVIEYKQFAEAKPLSKYQDNTLTILFLGRLVARKGCLQLLKAIDYLQQRQHSAHLPAYRLVVCGKGPLLASLQQFCRERNLEAIVTFEGFISEEIKPRYYASADLAVFPSTGGESFGIVLAEALAAGHSVVLGGDNSGYRAVLGSREELLFDPYDSAALADKLEFYLTHFAARKEIARWGSAYARRFDTTVVGRRLVRRYRQALRKRRAL